MLPIGAHNMVQVLEQTGSLSYLGHEYDQLGEDVKDNLKACIAGGYCVKTTGDEKTESADGETGFTDRITFTATKKAYDYMKAARGEV